MRARSLLLVLAVIVTIAPVARAAGQVDERWTRYITNNASGFAFYSAADQETTYAWDTERFRYSGDQSEYAPGGNPCLSEPARVKNASGRWVMGPSTTADPVKGLDDN